MRQTPKKRNIGFTIVEMAVVIAVISIMLTAAIPALDQAVNSYQRSAISIELESLNALMDEALDEQESISFTQAYAISETLYANSETIKDTKRLSDYLGVDKSLNTAVFYDSEESKWIYLPSEQGTDVYTALEDYCDSRYFLPIRTASDCKRFMDTGISLALLADLDASDCVDEENTLKLKGGLALNGHSISAVSKVTFAGEGATVELGEEETVSITYGEENASFLFKPEKASAQDDSLLPEAEAAEMSESSAAEFRIFGKITVQSLHVVDSTITLMPEAALTVSGELSVLHTAAVRAGAIKIGGESLTEESYSGGRVTAGSCVGGGSLVCGPITYERESGSLIPGQVQIDTEKGVASEDGKAYCVVENENIETAQQSPYLTEGVFGGCLCYSVSKTGVLSLYSVKVDETTLRLSAEGTERILEDGCTRIDAVTYRVDSVGTMHPYSVCVGDFLRLSKTETDSTVTYYVGEDGKTLYDEAESDGEETLTPNGYYYMPGSAKLSTEMYYTVTYHFYEYSGAQEVTYSENVSLGGSVYLPRPSRVGYVFADWNDKPDFTGMTYQVGEALGNISSDINLYARWSREETKRKLTLDFGTTPQFASNSSFKLELGGMVFNCTAGGNCTLEGFAIGGKRYEISELSGSSPLAEAYGYDEAGGDIYRRDTGVTVCAAEQPTVSLSGGRITVTAKGQSASVKLPEAVRDGFTFVGWSKNGVVIAEGNDTLTLTELTLEANWTEAAQPAAEEEQQQTGGETGGETGGGTGSGGCTHPKSFFTRKVQGTKVTVFGCADCLSYAPSGTTITLTENLELDHPLYIPEGYTYTLDLNGHNIVTSGDAIYNCGTLTLKSDGFTLPVLETDENGNLLFVSGSMKGYVIVNNGSETDDDKVNKNGVINWGTLRVEAVGVAVSDTYGNAIVNSGSGTTTVENSVAINTGLGNGIYANSGTVTLNTGTVVWSTTYGFAVFAYHDAEVIVNSGSYYSTVGFPLCLCGGTLDINQYCVTDRSADDSYAGYIEADGLSGEIYWLAGTLDTTGLEAIFEYANVSYDSSLAAYGATEKSWIFPKDFTVTVAIEDDDVYYEQWSSQVYRAANWTTEDTEYYEIDTGYIPDYVAEDKRVIQSDLPCYEGYVEDITIGGTTYKGIRYNEDGVYFNPFMTSGQSN